MLVGIYNPQEYQGYSRDGWSAPMHGWLSLDLMKISQILPTHNVEQEGTKINAVTRKKNGVTYMEFCVYLLAFYGGKRKRWKNQDQLQYNPANNTIQQEQNTFNTLETMAAFFQLLSSHLH